MDDPPPPHQSLASDAVMHDFAKVAPRRMRLGDADANPGHIGKIGEQALRHVGIAVGKRERRCSARDMRR